MVLSSSGSCVRSRENMMVRSSFGEARELRICVIKCNGFCYNIIKFGGSREWLSSDGEWTGSLVSVGSWEYVVA
jgi:hypothetical protein